MMLIVGLGNPGQSFRDTRHNIGFEIIEALSHSLHIQLIKNSHRSLFGKGVVADKRVILAKPLTYMNLSGEAVSSFLRYYKMNTRDLLLIYDDMDLPLGRIRIRERGGSGGHRGLDSVIDSIGRSDFPRIRIGIRGKKEEMDRIGYVLGRFSEEERRVVEKVVQDVVKAAETILREGVVKAMNMFNA